MKQLSKLLIAVFLFTAIIPTKVICTYDVMVISY